MERLTALDRVPAQDMSSLPKQIATALLGGGSVVVTAATELASVLAAVGGVVGRARMRVVRVRAPLDLPSFMGQVTPFGPNFGNSELEQGFTVLTQPDAECDRIALLVEDAHLIPLDTLRYIELALRAGPYLQVAFAGQPGIAETLALSGFAGLRKRLSLHIEVPTWPSLFVPAAEPPSPARLPVRHRWAALAGASMAVAVVLGVWFLPRDAAPPAMAVAGVGHSGTAELAVAPAMPEPAILDPDPIPVLTVAEPPIERPPVLAAEPPPAEVAASDSTPGPMPPVSASDVPAVATAGLAETPLGPQVTAVVQPLHDPALVVNLMPASPMPIPDLPVPPLPAAEAQSMPEATPVSSPPPLPARPIQAPARIVPVRSEPVAAKPTAIPDARRCRDIVLRVQLGEDPSDGDRTYLRNGCR